MMKILSYLRKRTVTLFLILFFFAVLCFGIQMYSPMVTLEDGLQVDHVPSELISYNKLGELFHKLGVIHPTTNHSKRYDQTETSLELEYNPFQKRRVVSDTFVQVGREDVLQQKALEVLEQAELKNGNLYVSLFTEEKNLVGPSGIKTNYLQRGKDWERLGFVAITRGEELLVKSGLGLRLHGGTSRVPSLPRHSYRVYFRKKYGRESVEDVFFDKEDALRRLIVHCNIPESWPLNNLIANELYSMLGVKTVEYVPAKFFLNGKDQGLYWLSPHLNRDYILKRFGYKSVHMHSYRKDVGKDLYKTELVDLLFARQVPLSIESVSKLFNIDDLINYFIGVIYSGNSDWDQGVAFKDGSRDDSQWNWMAWDLDHSFIDLYVSKSSHPDRRVWEQQGFYILMRPKVMNFVTGSRKLLMRRLLDEDPDFLNLFLKRYVDAFNHQISPDRLQKLYNKYQGIVESYGQKMNPLLLEFFEYRQKYLEYEFKNYFNSPEFVDVVVEGEMKGVVIDGYPEELPYHGRYPLGRNVQVNFGGQKGQSEYQINGKKYSGELITAEVDGPLVIKLGSKTEDTKL